MASVWLFQWRENISGEESTSAAMVRQPGGVTTLSANNNHLQLLGGHHLYGVWQGGDMAMTWRRRGLVNSGRLRRRIGMAGVSVLWAGDGGVRGCQSAERAEWATKRAAWRLSA